jgi:hypothetical protein
MAKRITYHPGGFIAAAPVQNKAELYDGTPNTYTRWNIAGAQLEQRPLTAAEAAALAAEDVADTAQRNGDQIRTRAAAAMTTNATFLAIASPNATQVANQTKALTRECNGLIRLLLGALTDVSDT